MCSLLGAPDPKVELLVTECTAVIGSHFCSQQGWLSTFLLFYYIVFCSDALTVESSKFVDLQNIYQKLLHHVREMLF